MNRVVNVVKDSGGWRMLAVFQSIDIGLYDSKDYFDLSALHQMARRTRARRRIQFTILTLVHDQHVVGL